MPRKPKVVTPPHPPPVPEWDRNTKEPWHQEFEREHINDDRWTCIVAAAVQSEDKDEECITTYTQSVNTGLRRAVKIISMADVIALLKEHVKPRKDSDPSKTAKGEKNKIVTNSSISGPPLIVELAAKYATITDTDCQLAPDLMAAVIKYMILRLKEENCFLKKVEAVRARRLRERNIRAKFIRQKKPFEKRQEEPKSFSMSQSSALLGEEPINDEPIDGPDLYIMLVDFYDVSHLEEMLKMNVPLVAVLKIFTNTYGKEEIVNVTPPSLPEAHRRKKTLLLNFWDKLKHECIALETTNALKDVAMMQYTAPPQIPEWKEYRRMLYDELTWTLYSAHCIYRQHQKYLQEMHVQRLILSLETLDLSRCNVYNKLCDALITGEPLTPLMVLYAIVEQVVAGVPETKNTALEYRTRQSVLSPMRRRTSKKRRFTKFSSSIFDLKDKTERSPDKQKESITTGMRPGSEHSMEVRVKSASETRKKISVGFSEEKLGFFASLQIAESLLDQVLSERKTEKELKAEKRWKTPFLCAHGDSVFRQSFYCDPRLFDAEEVVRRFLGNSKLFHVWNKYPKLSPEERVYYNYHFFSLWKISGLRQDLLKLKIYFMLATKLMGITKSYLYRGADENVSISLSDYGRDKPREKSRMTSELNLFEVVRGRARNFSSYFYKTFIADMSHKGGRKAVMSIQENEWGSSTYQTDSNILMKITSHLNVFLMSHGSLKKPGLKKDKPFESTLEQAYQTLHFLVDCIDLTNLSENHFLVDNEFHLKVIKSYKYYEKLEPNLMVQRVLEAAENFNTIQYWHFTPTDTLIITMHDDFDHRGLFYSASRGALPTPVSLRDFYIYVYPEINEWLINDNTQRSKIVAEMIEKSKAQEEKEEEEYLALLNQEFDKMSPEKQTEFLETVEEPQIEIDEKDLSSLPRKRRPIRSNKTSFVTTNFMDLRVESDRKVHEFHSLDGTKVNVSIDSWLYKPPNLLQLEVKRSDFLLYYHQWIGQETNTSFTFKTISGLIFSFYKNEEAEDDLKYYVTISWPTGLLIRPIWTDSTIYVKQFYLKNCRKGWKIEEEESRCFLKNGQIIVFKSNGDYDVLCPSGTKYSFYDSATIPRYEIVSTTGEVWEIRTKGPCRNRKKVISRNKIFIGVDPKTHEAFYKREDGVQCMLWHSGRLVTSYPDGTKITSTPYFEEEEVILDWTGDEKVYFEQLVHRYKSEQSVQEPRSRTILRNSSTTKSVEAKSFEFEGFISVSCAYLSEHPKYSSVHTNRMHPYLRVTLPENLSIQIREEGAYEIQKEKHFLRVQDTEVVFQTICYDCSDTSTLKLNLDSNETLLNFVDFFRKEFCALRNGSITFHEHNEPEESKTNGKTDSNSDVLCASRKTKISTTYHRCFVLERDLSGLEFLHEDYVAHNISKHTTASPLHLFFHSDHKDEDNDSDSTVFGHTFSGQYSKAGYEKWVMNYEDPLDSLPINIKKKDLRELGTKHVTKNLFQYPFPKSHKCGHQQQKEKVKRNVYAPKLIVSRTILCLSPNPDSVINEVKRHVTEYQKHALNIFESYKDKKPDSDYSKDSRHIEMRLKKIAIALNQNLHMYPHLCDQWPSTEMDIHYFGHLINKTEELKLRSQDEGSFLPNCKQIPNLPRIRKYDSIREENETTNN